MAIIPSMTPHQILSKTEEIINKHNIGSQVKLLGMRGYFDKDGKNQRGIYDDAIFLVSPTCYLAVNANCDPGSFSKGIASLIEGVHWYKLGIHGLNKPQEKQYEALVQAAKVTVTRDGAGQETGFFGINIHRGSINSVSSLGCQTIPPKEWPGFIATVKAQMSQYNQKIIPYLLISQKGDEV